MTLWDQSRCSFGTVDETGSGSIRFIKNVEVTGDCVADPPLQAVLRLFSLFLVSKMMDDGLDETCRSLSEIYSHHATRLGSVEAPVRLPVVSGIQMGAMRASRPFELE